jgi:hypothetical protein
MQQSRRSLIELRYVFKVNVILSEFLPVKASLAEMVFGLPHSTKINYFKAK